MKVLSLFDGISCGQLALERAGIKVDKYYASEIDKHAMKVTQHHYPNTIQLGDVTKIKASDLPQIDLLIGGSPCQGFSFAGKQLNFEDPRSVLFFEFVRLLKELKPKYFLLENVKMKKEFEKVITEHLGVEPILINSNLVSSQNRQRLYWANFPITQPEDKHILLKDIIDDDFCFHSTSMIDKINKAYSIEEIYKDQHMVPVCVSSSSRSNGVIDRRISNNTKAHTLTAKGYSLRSFTGVMQDGHLRALTLNEQEKLQTLPVGYTKMISANQRQKSIGNGWTVDVITHILKGLKWNE